MTTDNDPQNDYFANVESAGEKDRLIKLDHLMTDITGGLFPQHQFFGGEKVFDAACGPGGWCIRLAKAWPNVQVTGMDISKNMIEYARAFVEAGVSNASFLVGDIKSPLPFEDATFDAVNARFLETFMRPQNWHDFLKECYRVLVPGGTVRLMEAEMLMSPLHKNVEQLTYWSTAAMHQLGSGYSDHYMGNTAMLRHYLKDAGFEQIQQQGTAIDSSYGTPYHHGVYLTYFYGSKEAEAFIRKYSIVSPDENVQEVIRLALEEMRDPGYIGLNYLLTCWGQKPM